MDRRCETCEWFNLTMTWDEKGERYIPATFGSDDECRRYAPRAEVGKGYWAKVDKERDWCGEWTAREASDE